MENLLSRFWEYVMTEMLLDATPYIVAVTSFLLIAHILEEKGVL